MNDTTTPTSPTPAMVGSQVYLLLFDHEYGTDAFVFADLADAYRQVASYCRDWWSDLNTDTEPPDNDDDLIDEYFHEHPKNEGYRIEPLIVG